MSSSLTSKMSVKRRLTPLSEKVTEIVAVAFCAKPSNPCSNNPA